MTPEEVYQLIGSVPMMRIDQAKVMTSFIHQNGIHDILELGFLYGASTCYLAAAVAGQGGSVVTIDRELVKSLQPNIEQLLDKVHLRDYVKIYWEPISYNWRLMKMLDDNPNPRFDLCYIDGSHQWVHDGFAFFLVDRLLRPGGWIILDDLDWRFSAQSSLRNVREVRAMTQEERSCSQVRKIYELLVKTHPSYGDFCTKGNWAYAHKIQNQSLDTRPVKSEVIVRTVPIPWHRLFQAIRKIPQLVSRQEE